MVHFDSPAPNRLKVSFDEKADFGIQLGRILEAFSQFEVKLIGIDSAGELEDAFLKRLAEDRLKGFARAFETGPVPEEEDEVGGIDINEPVESEK